MLTAIPDIEFTQCISPHLEDDSFLDVNSRNLIVLDDLMSDVGKDQRITDLFTKGSHHRNLSVIVLMQNFYEPKTVTIRRNAHYLILFNMPGDLQQVKLMSQRMFPHKPNYLMEEYTKAIAKPYGYLTVDLKPDTPAHARLRTDVVPTEPPVESDKPSDQPSPTTRTESYKWKPDTPSQTTESYKYKPSQIHRFGPPGLRKETNKFQLTPKMASCNYCGIVFADIDELQHHLVKWCFEKPGNKRPHTEEEEKPFEWIGDDDYPLEEEEEEDSEEESEDNSVFDPLIWEVEDDMEDEFLSKVEGYKSQGMTPRDAKTRAHKDLLPRYAKATRAKYAKWWELLYDLKRNKIHNTIKKTLEQFMELDDMDWNEALNMALQKRKFLFKELWEKYIDEQNKEG